MTTTASIARDLVTAYRAVPPATIEVLTRRLAPRVQVRHDPPDPTDGDYDASTVLAALTDRQITFFRIMPDHRTDVTASSADDTITMDLTITGTLPSGQRVRISGTDTLHVHDGKIVTIVSRFDPDEMRPLVAAIQGHSGDVKSNQAE